MLNIKEEIKPGTFGFLRGLPKNLAEFNNRPAFVVMLLCENNGWEDGHLLVYPCSNKRAERALGAPGIGVMLSIHECQLEPSREAFLSCGPLWFMDKDFGHLRRPRVEDDTWGLCPECEKIDGLIGIGYKGQWGYCREHKAMWLANDFLNNQTEEEQRRIYDELGCDSYRDVKPTFRLKPITEANILL